MPSNTGEHGRIVDRARRFWSGHHRARLLLTLTLAVMLPAAALIVINASHLKSIERDKVMEAAIHREFQYMLAISEKQINQKAYQLAEEVRSAFPPPDTERAEREMLLDDILSTHPFVAHVFLYEPGKGLVFRSQPERLDDPEFHDEHKRLGKAFDGWFSSFDAEAMLEGIHKAPRAMTWYSERLKRADGYAYLTTAFFSPPQASKDCLLLGGVSFDADYLKQTFFPKMLEELIAYKLGEKGANPLAMIVYPAESASDTGWSPAAGRPSKEFLAASAGWTDGKPEVSRNLDEVFRGLALGIKFQGTSVEALGQRWVHNSMAILGVLSLVLIGGLGLTYRSVSKEIALARLKSDFVSNVSHELRTPLALIRLYAETLELGRITTQVKAEEYYRIIRTESERLTSLINNILDFSRIEAGRKEYEFRTTDMAELVTNTLDTYRGQIDEQGFTFEQSIDPGIPLVRVDREAIARSLVNLVNNALKYSDRQKFLMVKLYRTDRVVKLEVADRGIGIARSEQSKIFEKFYRAGDPLVHNTKGSGLGLSLVRHIAHAHGGGVDVESSPGNGSTFTLWLPLAPGAQQPANDEPRRVAG